ncbi:MAG: hypothetical protein HOP19_27590, partial [Acidobacteria bacterium]|nr:hypothetical protein [Acidobacteriota bacterium]
ASTGTSNRNPVITSTLSDQTLVVGQTLELPLSATDADNDPITFALENAPAFITLVQANPAARTAVLRIAPPLEGSDASSSLRVRADDGRGGVSTSNNLVVNIRSASGGGGGGDNRPPTAIAGVLVTTVQAGADGNATLRLDGTASSDPDGDALSYTWLNRGVVIATNGIADVQLPVGDHLISLRVSDNRGGIATTLAQSVKVTAAPVVAALSIQSVTPASGKQGTTVVVTITGTGFQPGALVDFSGANISEVTTYVNSTTLTVRVAIGSNAFTTVRTVYVSNPDGTYTNKAKAFQVTQ